MKNIKKIFMLPALDTSIEDGCVTPLCSIFSWRQSRSSLRGTKQSEFYTNELHKKISKGVTLEQNTRSLNQPDLFSCQCGIARPSQPRRNYSFTSNTIMSTSFRIYAAAIVFCLITFSSCIKDVSPSDAIFFRNAATAIG